MAISFLSSIELLKNQEVVVAELALHNCIVKSSKLDHYGIKETTFSEGHKGPPYIYPSCRADLLQARRRRIRLRRDFRVH